jgi:hypothetical protein
MNVQEVKAAAAEAVKDLAVHEKQQVGLEERSKHAKSKAKKLKKSLQDVSCFYFDESECLERQIFHNYRMRTLKPLLSVPLKAAQKK